MKNEFEVTADAVKNHMKSGKPLFLINVRHHHDWDTSVMKPMGALRIPDDEMDKHLEEIPRDRPVIICTVCPGDGPSVRAARFLQQHGWDDVHPLVGGFRAYLREGLPVDEIGEGSTVRRMMYLS
jgi:rhodanese-related sulfurtransferase